MNDLKHIIFKLIILIFISISIENSFGQNLPYISKACAARSGNDVIINITPHINNCGTFQSVDVYAKQNAVLNYNLIGTINSEAQLFFVHTNALASGNNWVYKLRYKFLCNNDSIETNEVEIDFTPPITTEIDSISYDQWRQGSVNATERDLLIGWSKDNLEDTRSFIIWNSPGNNNIPSDTVWEQLYWMDSLTIKYNDYSFSLSVLDTCYNQSTISSKHRPISLSFTFDTCKEEISLNWIPYLGWQNSIRTYRIYLFQFGNTPILIDSTNSLNYTFSYANYSGQISFFVQAVSNITNFSSSSNRQNFDIRRTPNSAYNYISSVNYISDNEIEIEWNFDNNPYIKDVYLMRENIINGIKDTVYKGKTNSNLYIESDLISYFNKYRYQVITRDNCLDFIDSSNIGTNIILDLNQNNNQVNLIWNSYEDWNNGVQEYIISEGLLVNNSFTWNIKSSVNDTFIQFSRPELDVEMICYQIEAIELDPPLNFNQGRSLSNIRCIIDSPKVYFPTAFTPGGLNPTFRPKGVGIDLSKSKMEIFNRWGEKVFTQTDIRSGWNGKNLQDADCPSGVYVYLCRIIAYDGSIINNTGTITLIR